MPRKLRQAAPQAHTARVRYDFNPFCLIRFVRFVVGFYTAFVVGVFVRLLLSSFHCFIFKILNDFVVENEKILLSITLNLHISLICFFYSHEEKNRVDNVYS